MSDTLESLDQRLTFTDCLMQTAAHAEFVAEFDHLMGCNLSLKGLPIELMIDEACGRLDHDLALFVAFVKDVVWDRLPPEIRRSEGENETQ